MGVDRVSPGTAAVVQDAEFQSFATAMIRETKEGIGLVIEIFRVIGVYSDPAFWIFRYPDGNRARGFTAFECAWCPENPYSI